MIEVDLTTCDECGTCISVCPADAIVLGDHIAISEEKCVACCNCVNICPFGCLHMTRGKIG